MKRKVKFLVAITFLLTFILIGLTRLNYPLQVSTETSILHMIPFYYWILIILIPLMVIITFLLTESKTVCLFLAVIYFFTLYSFFLFFVIPPAGTDISEGGYLFLTIKESSVLSVENIGSYFEWPIHYVFYSVFKQTLGARLSVLTIWLFSFIIMIPIFFSLSVNKYSSTKTYMALPVGYIILSYYFINLQLVPQFTGLIFLILTIGSYFKYKEYGTKRLLIMTILFYIICVFSHPFIFVFFPVAIFLDRYVIPKKIFRTKKNNYKIPLSLLIGIYFSGFLFRFARMERITRRLFYPANGRGEAWGILGHLIRGYDPTPAKYQTFPLYRLVSERMYLISRYTTYVLLITIVLLLAYILLKKLREVDSFDVSLGVSGVSWFLLGLVEPSILGQRGFQVAFIGVPRYFKDLFKSKKKIFVILLVICISIAPFLFTTNWAVNQGLSGGRHIQDEATIYSGRFVTDNVESEYNVTVAGLSYFPGRNHQRYNFTIYSTRSIADGSIEWEEIDMIIQSPKLKNRMEYFGLELDYDGQSQIYDNGDSQVLIYNN